MKPEDTLALDYLAERRVHGLEKTHAENLLEELTVSQRTSLKVLMWTPRGLKSLFQAASIPHSIQESTMKKTLSQAGFSLIEMMVVLAVTTSLFCMAMPNPATLNAIFIEKGARRNVSQIYQVVTSDTICHAVVSATPQGTTPPNCGPLDLQMPSALPVVLNGYSYQYALNSDGTWSETATPVNTLPGLRTVTITQAGVLMCSGAACPLQGL